MSQRKLTGLASAVALAEGNKSQARIGDIREILKILATMEAERMVKGKPVEGGPSAIMDAYTNSIAARMYSARAKLAKAKKSRIVRKKK